MSLLNDLLLQNPMLSEAKRFVRRFVGIRAGAFHVVAMVVLAAVYVLLVGLVAATREVPVFVVVMFQTVLYCLVLPPMLQGCVAGEREKGTWESLLVAPVSKAQIVVGKYWGAVLVVLGLAVLMAPPLIWANTGSSYITHPYGADPGYGRLQVPWSQVLLMELVSVMFGLMLAAWCVLVSARSKRSFSAQGMIYGSLIGALIAWPIVSDMAFGHQYGLNRLLNCLNPFYIVPGLQGNQFDPVAAETVLISGVWPQLFCYVVATTVLLVWAERTLRFAESDVRFLPGGKSASNR